MIKSWRLFICRLDAQPCVGILWSLESGFLLLRSTKMHFMAFKMTNSRSSTWRTLAGSGTRGRAMVWPESSWCVSRIEKKIERGKNRDFFLWTRNYRHSNIITFHKRFIRPLILSITEAKWTRHALATPRKTIRHRQRILARNQYWILRCSEMFDSKIYLTGRK